jgi:hypothetical protein
MAGCLAVVLVLGFVVLGSSIGWPASIMITVVLGLGLTLWVGRYNERNEQAMRERQSDADEKLIEHDFFPEWTTPLKDRKTFFSVSTRTPGVAVCNSEGACEVIPVENIKDGYVSNMVETTIESRGGMTGLEVSGAFFGRGGSNTTVTDRITQSWICLRVRDFDTPERWFCFASPEEARTQMNRIELLLESQESANL